MPSEVILPRVDMDMTTGKIAKWFVESGATVTKGQPLFEIETDKAAMEIEAPATGTIRDLAEASGTDIPVGSVVAWIFGDGEAPAAEPAASETADAVPPVKAAEANVAQPPAAAGPGEVGDGRRATPMARRLARLGGIDLAAIVGTGPRGRIQAGDVDAARPQDPAPGPPVSAPPLAALQMPETTAAPATATGRAAASLAIVRLREGEGRPTLLIHGFGADAGTWRPLLAGRGSDRPILALDMPGHGASTLGSLDGFADLVEAIEAALLAADLGPVDLVGHSLGGAVASALAARGALDIRTALLIAPAGLGPAMNGAFVDGFLRADSEASLTPWMRELVADPAAITPAFVRATLKARAGTALAATQRRVADAVFPAGTQAFSIRADLARLSIPARVIVGTADRILPAAQVDGLPGRIALHRFAGVGHMPTIEIRDDVLAIMAQMTGVRFA
jgi:pyruvate dehydrogenase E2 component (dihydrolipoamide acetyltransferase)